MFLNVCFKDSSSTFQVFGCFFLLCINAHSFARMFASPKEKKKRLFMFWIQHTGLANLPLQPNRNKLFDFNWTKSEWRSKLYFLQRCSILLLHVVRLFQWLPFYGRVICFFFFFASFLVFVEVSWMERH